MGALPGSTLPARFILLKKIIPNARVVLLMTRLVFCLRFEPVKRVGGVCGAFPQFCGSETSTDSDELKGCGKEEILIPCSPQKLWRLQFNCSEIVEGKQKFIWWQERVATVA